ncbi:MAG: sulfatase-like hydrolase/transferase [Planctomycetes bacterium]|jgi:arylsulfatase A-like enzyme|nr:sulfatase-like hydrolase/transferase [Planctomycetota bacterium]
MTDDRPNLIVIFPDQLRRDAIGCYGDRNISTPHMDALASSGVRFNQACSTYPICVPFRFTLMTGHYAHSRRAMGCEFRMSPAERTLADEFNAAGYETIYIGKWHLHYAHTRVPREHQGRWSKWMGFEVRNKHFDTYYWENDDPTPHRIDQYQTDGLFDMTMDYLREGRDRDKPFCCVLSPEPPHFPYEAPEEYEQRWEGRELQLPPSFARKADRPAPDKADDPGPDPEEVKQLLRKYYAMVENFDDNVGRLMRFLDETHLAKNTIVVLLSDHGEMGGAQNIWIHLKSYPYEPSVGIPLMVRDPRHPGRAGAQVDAVTCTEDLFPTLCGLAGIMPRNDLPGRDLTPLITGEVESLDREGVMLQFVGDHRPDHPFHNHHWRTFRSDRFKYTVIGDTRTFSRPWHFFDLHNDPHEVDNLVDLPQWQDQIARHHKLLRERMIQTNDFFCLSPAHGCAGLNEKVISEGG